MAFMHTAIFSLFLLWHGSAAQTDVNITVENPLIMGVPVNTAASFMRINQAETSYEKRYTGFSFRVFQEVLKLLKYKINYKLVEFDGTYDDLVASVSNKTFDAAIGDITVTAERWRLVDFTVPFTESGLSMVVPKKSVKGWIFLSPFTAGMWAATGGILVYTMSVVWFLEHRSNPEFSGPWHVQLGNALWFTFSTLFFAHREKIRSNHTRVVVVMWLFVVLILTQSFTASLSSMLTVTRLNPNIDFLTKDTKIGCEAFVERFIRNEHWYKSENIELMGIDDHDYLNAFSKGTISAALLEIPYAKLFVNNHCKDFTINASRYLFGGLSFAFQKGSPIANDVSEAILKLSENGMLKQLKESWLLFSSECSDSQANQISLDRLSFQSFWGFYLFSITITTVCFLLFIARLLKDNGNHRQGRINGVHEDDDETIWNKLIDILRYLKNAEPGTQIVKEPEYII